MKKKTIIIMCVVAVALILLVPVPMHLKDGGSVKYSALLYSVTDVHRMDPVMDGYEEGTIIKILGFKVYNNVIALENDYSQEEMEAKLKGEHRDNIIASWGEPDGHLSGFWGEVWFLDDVKDKKVILYYDADGCVENVRIGSRSKETVVAILSDIEKEGIVSARFDSHIPNYIYDIEDTTLVDKLLTSLEDATYEVCDRPKEPWGSIEAIYITTNEKEYYLGVIENSAFRVSVNGEGEYYTCSNKDDFQNKLLELQGR